MVNQRNVFALIFCFLSVFKLLGQAKDLNQIISGKENIEIRQQKIDSFLQFKKDVVANIDLAEIYHILAINGIMLIGIVMENAKILERLYFLLMKLFC